MTTGSPPGRSRRRIRRGVIAILVIFVLAVLFLVSPLSPLHVCSLVGCYDSLEVTFSRLPPAEYTILVTSSTGDVRRATCVPGYDLSRTLGADRVGPVCTANSVVFYDFAPRGVEIQVTWQGGGTSVTGKPSYRILRPNGALCAPGCRQGTIQVQVP